MKNTILIFLTVLSVNTWALNNRFPTSDVYNGGRGISFNDSWNFYHGDASGADAVAFNDASWRKLNLPHDFGIENTFNPSSPSTSEGGFLDGGIAWYRKTFSLPDTYNGKSISITFDGAFMNTEVWINGHYLGIRPYGFITFQYDITPYLKFGTTANVIAVKVNNIQKSCRWYSGSGIYRNVWLTVLNPVHIAFCGSAVTTPLVSTSTASLVMNTDVQNQATASQTVTLNSILLDNTGVVVATGNSTSSLLTAGTTGTLNTNITVNSPTLWSLENPNLYTLKTFVINNALKVDSFSSTVGFRNAVFDPNTGFSLNGKNIKIHGVCMHQDLGSLGSAQNYRALERQVEIMKNMGVNGIRTSHNPPAPELLEICDRLGILVMDEIFDCWSTGKDSYDYHLNYATWMPQDVKNWVMRDRNHPSVIMWSAGNEIPQMDASGLTCLNNIKTEIKKQDTSRPVTMGLNNPSYIPINDALDIVGFNYANGGTYDNYHAAHPTSIILGSETSSAVRSRGEYYTPTTSNILTNPDLQCSSYDNSVVGWGHSAEDSWRFDRDREFVVGQFIWTGFDYIGEPTPYNYTYPVKSSYFGIVDLCGFPKDIYYFYQSQWTASPMVHILPHWNWQPGTTIPVWAYTNCDSVSLFLNGNSVGTKKFVTGGAMHLEWQIPFVAGSLKALAFRNGVVVARDSVFTADAANQLELKVDRNKIQANGLDLAFIETNILDANGVFCPSIDSLVNYTITGPGKIVGVDNGNAASVKPFKATQRKLFNGKCMAVVQSTGIPGDIVVTAGSPDFKRNIASGKTATADSENNTQLQNIALGKTATSDTEQNGNFALNATDGSTSTRWCATDGNAGHWLKIDLGSTKNMIGAEILWEKSGNAYLYKLETSTDNVIWSTVVDRTVTNTNTAQNQSSSFVSTARYIRISITGGVSSSVWASIFEFRVFDGSQIPMANGNVASKGNDVNSGTYWMAADGNANHWWMVDLGSTVAVKGSTITWMNAGIGYQYKIETSIDKSTWSIVSDKTTSTGTLQTISDSYSSNARYIRVTVTGGVNDINRANIAEFKVFDGTTTTFKPASITIQAIESIPATGIQQPTSKTTFLIYPNPVSTALTIEFDGNPSTPKLVEIYNTMGQKILTRNYENTTNKVQVPVTGFSSGIYFLKINGDSQKFRVVKS